ncbi:MAG TPA: 50S ribosomal protein L23 [Turneriella sp.]|nr:50S ribosomal protein L23 [Turneriella sp.]
MNVYDIIKKPLVSEKAEQLRAQNCYVFEVALASNKKMIKDAVRKIFNVTPEKINTLILRSDAKANRHNIGYTKRRKKAYVFLKKSDKISLFEGV